MGWITKRNYLTPEECGRRLFSQTFYNLGVGPFSHFIIDVPAWKEPVYCMVFYRAGGKFEFNTVTDAEYISGLLSIAGMPAQHAR